VHLLQDPGFPTQGQALPYYRTQDSPTTIKTAVRENVSNKTAKDCVVVLGF